MPRVLMRSFTLAIALIALSGASSALAAPFGPPSTALIGDRAIESHRDSLPARHAEAFAFLTGKAGFTQSAHVYIDAHNTARTLVVGLYANAHGHPGKLLASGSLRSLRGGGWNAARVPAVKLAPRTVYWLAVLGTGGTLRYRDRQHGRCRSETSARPHLGALRARWRMGKSYRTCPISAYVSSAGSVLPGGPLSKLQLGSSPGQTRPGALGSSALAPGLAGPINTAPPVISGAAIIGHSLLGSTGAWSGSPTSFAYQWQDCDEAGNGCVSVAGASAASYGLGAADVGHTIRVIVTASNIAGSSATASAPTSVVVGKTFTCKATVSPGMSAGAVAGAIVSAHDGDTVCMEGGKYPKLTITGAKHGAFVTIRPVPGAKVDVEGEVLDSSFLRFQELSSSNEGWRVRNAIHDIQWIDDTFTGHRGLQLGNGQQAKKLVIEGSTFQKLTIANDNCSVSPGVGEGQGITMEWTDGVTIRHNKFKEIVWHYLQSGEGGPEGIKVENNLFEGPIPGGKRGECTHLNVWQIFDGSENDTFSNNIVRGEPGHPAAVTPILFQHGVGPYPCSLLYTNLRFENNLFLYSSTGYVAQIYNTNNLIFSHNTIVGGEYGTWLERSDPCGAGKNMNVERNIAVQTQSSGAPARWVLDSCIGLCTFDFNVSDDGTANTGGSTHYLVNWKPSWESTAFGSAGFYLARSLPFEAGYRGGGGP